MSDSAPAVTTAAPPAKKESFIKRWMDKLKCKDSKKASSEGAKETGDSAKGTSGNAEESGSTGLKDAGGQAATKV